MVRTPKKGESKPLSSGSPGYPPAPVGLIPSPTQPSVQLEPAQPVVQPIQPPNPTIQNPKGSK